MNTRKSVLWGFFCLLFFTPNAKSQLVENLFIGNTKAFAMANAVTADPPGIDSIHFNPAGLTRLRGEGRMTELHFIGIGGASVDMARDQVDNPYGNSNVFFDDCRNECLLGEDGVDTEEVEELEMDALQIYFPGVGVIKLDASNGKSYGAIPRGAFAYRPKGSKFVFATSVYVNLALGYKMKKENADDFGGIEDVAIGSFNLFAPTLAWQINDAWSIGFSVGGQNMGLAAGINYRFADPFLGAVNQILLEACPSAPANTPLCLDGEESFPPFSSLAKLDFDIEDTLTPSFSMGLLWQPNNWFTWGLLYRTQVKHRLKGNVNLTYSPALATLFQSNLLEILPSSARSLPQSQASESVNVQVPFTMPRHISTGVSLNITPRLKFNMDYKWTEYSKWDTWTINFEKNIQLSGLLWLINDGQGRSLDLPVGLVDKGNQAYAVEYIWSDKLTLRAGYEYRPSVVPEESKNAIIPIEDITLKNFGLAYRWDKDTIAELGMGVIKSHHSIEWEAHNPLHMYPGRSQKTVLEIPIVMFSWNKYI